jgi:hypothetical protein
VPKCSGIWEPADNFFALDQDGQRNCLCFQLGWAIEWSKILPTRRPSKPRAKSVRASDIRPDEVSWRETGATHAEETIDWLALWALSVGFCGLVLAATAFYTAEDPAGASMILFGAAAIVTVTLGVSVAPNNRN